MNGTIYDFQPLPRLALEPLSTRFGMAPLTRESGHLAPALVGVISNPRSHRNQAAQIVPGHRPDVLVEAPATRAELREVLARFAARRIDLLVIDGGDGTIRDVLTCAESIWGERWPRIAVLPSGKTNALAVDIGVPRAWTLDDAIRAASEGSTVKRAPIEIERVGAIGTKVRGFLFGAGAFVDATALAQRTHRAGAFNGVAVGLAILWGIAQTLFGGARSPWRRGSRIALRFGAGARRMHGARLDGDQRRYLVVASTLERLPTGIRPFGQPRPGLKTLVVDAPPRALTATFPAVVAGSEDSRLEERGYHRIDAEDVTIDLDSSFILDGEIFPPGVYTLRHTAPLRFVAP